jgi:hypothetical protein
MDLKQHPRTIISSAPPVSAFPSAEPDGRGVRLTLPATVPTAGRNVDATVWLVEEEAAGLIADIAAALVDLRRAARANT